MLPGCNPHASEMNNSEERDNDPETPTTRASLGSPGFVPPVIFAGLASPSTGSRPATQKRFNQFLRSSKTARGGRRGSQDGGVSTEQSDFSKAYKKRSQSVCCYKTSATVANESVCDTGLISQLSTSPFLTSPSQRSSTDGVDDPSAFVKHDDPPFQKSRFSLLSVSSSRLNTPRMPPPLHTEDCKDSLLEQINELEAALAHSKARETLFSHSYDKLREEVAAKDAKLEEREVLLETLEQEHRRVKASFRELMDATLNTSIPESVCSETMDDEKINETPNVFMTDVDATGTAPEATSVSETRQKQRSWYSAFTRLRGTKELTTDENVAAQGAELQQKLVQVEELLTTLRGTNNYVQKVLQRNSELEQRCTQLEEGRDERIRELHNELSRARRDRDASEALAARLKHELEQSNEQIGVLHRELRDMHEKQRLRRVLVHELQDVKDENESLRDILAAEKLEAQRAAMEWEQEKALLQADLAFAQRKITATTASRDQETHATPPNILAQRIGELEELLSNNRQEMQEKVNELREKHADAEKSLRTISQRLEAAQKHESELKNSVTNFESENTMLQTQLAKAQHDVCLLRAENATLNERALEVEEVKAKLQAAQEQLDSQTKQINRHLQTIKNANERYAELVESKTVLDCLLHSQQKEKEKTIAETVRTHEQLYDQSNSYRQRLEKANREIAELRKQLAEGEEQLQNAVQSVEVTKLKEVRQIKEQYAQSKRVVISDYDKKLTQLRESYEKDIAEFRQQKEEMTDALVAQYEGYLKELKSVHEKKLQYVQETKETALQKLRDELAKRVADIQALTKERLSKQRELHEEELNALRSMYHKNLQNQLQHQAKEAEELRRSLDTLRQDSDQRLMVANQKVEELSALLQQHRLRETQSEEERDTAWAQVLTERDSLRLALSDIASKHQEELKKLEELHKEALAFLERKLTLSQSLLEESQHEENRLRSKLEEVQAEEIKLRQHLLERTVRAETEKTTETTTTISVVQITDKENRQDGSNDVSPANADKTFSVTPFVEPTVVQELQESLNLAESAVKQLQERLEHETQLLQSQLDAKEERLQSFLKTQQHVTDILARNSELENTVAKDAQRFSELLEKKSDEVTQLEAVNARLEHLVKEQGTQLTSLQSQLEYAEVQLQRLNNMALKEKETQSIIASQQNRIFELLEKLEEASSRNNDLTDNTKHVSNGEEPAVLKDSEMVAQSRRHLDSLKLLADELAVTRNENRRLLREMEELHESAKESSRISLELALLKHRVETQEETIEILRERSQNKQAVIDELTTQLRSQSSNDEEPDPVHSTDSQAQLQTKIQELTRKCQQLENQKLCYEHDRRAAQHRIELEQQILAQCMEQKERQMRHLIETNQRAEALFARNAELEALLYTLQTERESHRCSVSAPYRSSTASKLKQDEITTQQETTSTCSTESESLQAMLKDKEERIHKLMEELRVSKALYMKEIETLTTRLHFATLEQSLVPLSSEDDLLKLLVEKTTELQREVARLQKERDENRVSSGSSGQRCSASWRDDDVIHLQTRIETLLGEREALRKQVSHLVSSRNSTSTAPHLSTATSSETSIAHGLSLRCRLELILKRYRNALDFLTSDPGSTAFFVKEMVHLNMEMDTLIREMDDSSPRTTDLTDSAVMSETESISTRTSLSNVVTREHTIEANESISVVVRSSSDYRSKYPSLEDKESDGFSGLQNTSEAESTQALKDSTCYNETASIETDLQQDDENKYPVPLPERSASRRSKRHRGVPINTAAVKQVKRTSFHQSTAAPVSANLANDASVEEAKTTKEPANA